MKFKNTIKILAVSMAFVIGSSSMVQAATFKDVPSSHWAYSAIDNVSNKGLIVGDLNGNFSPNSYVDKFSTSKILARLLGFKATGASAEEQKYYNDAYNKNKNFLSLYKNKFTRWDSTADMEISFLLERGVLTAADLDQFVIISQASNTEALTAITREDIALLLVRAMDEVTESNSYRYSNLFRDDASINGSKKASVYYLKSKGIINGDSNNNFNPKSATTKATLAILIDKTHNYIYGSNQNSTSEKENNNATTVKAVSGTIDVYYESLNTLQIKSEDGTTQIYVINAEASITVDGLLRTKNDLKTGMNIVGVVTDGKTLIDIKASTAKPTTPTDNNNNNNNNNNNSNNNNNNNNNNSNNTVTTSIEGLVSNVNTGKSTVSIDTRVINPRGEIITTTTVYSVPSTAIIERADKSTSLSKIAIGDIIYGKVVGNELVEIELEAKDLSLYGIVNERGYDSVNGKSYYIIEDEKDDAKTYKLYIDSKSILKRKGGGTVAFNDVKIGDAVEVYATFNIITELYATGKTSYVDGSITAIYISEDESYLVVNKTNGDKGTEKFYATNNLKNIYNVEVGSKVELTLDSKEIIEIDNISTSTTKMYSGFVNEVNRNNIVIRETKNTSSPTTTIYYNSDTKFIKSSTGTSTNPGVLEEDDQIFISYTGSSSSNQYADIITIIQ